MDTKAATTQIRLANWANIIKARNESGLTIDEYCEQNGLSRSAYFYWLRKLRYAALESQGPRFIELQEAPQEIDPDRSTGKVTVEWSDIRINVSGPSARDTFAMVVEVLRNAE